jgi:hypothetical protein
MPYRMDQLQGSLTVREMVRLGQKRRQPQGLPQPKEWRHAASATSNGEMPCLNLKNRIVLSASGRSRPGNRLDTETSEKVAEGPRAVRVLWGNSTSSIVAL